MKIVIDSYTWIEHFLGSEKGRKIDNILESADEVYTPDTVLAEVARKYVREGVDLMIINTRLAQIVGASTIICLDAKLAIDTAQCYLEIEAKARKSKLTLPSLLDAVVLAISRSLDSKVLTGDQHFRELPDTIWIG